MTRPNRFLFDETAAACREPNRRMIIEIGGIRNLGWRDADGHSTLRWPVDTAGWSVDTDPAAVKLTRTVDRHNVAKGQRREAQVLRGWHKDSDSV